MFEAFYEEQTTHTPSQKGRTIIVTFNELVNSELQIYKVEVARDLWRPQNLCALPVYLVSPETANLVYDNRSFFEVRHIDVVLPAGQNLPWLTFEPREVLTIDVAKALQDEAARKVNQRPDLIGTKNAPRNLLQEVDGLEGRHEA